MYYGSSFSLRVVGPWNSLPEEIVEAGTTNTFKNKLDRYWTTNPNQSRVMDVSPE